MVSLLQLTIPTRPPSPGFYGGCDIAGGWIAFPTELILRRMTARRDRLAERPFPDNLEAAVERLLARRRERLADSLRRPFGQPYDPEAFAAERREEKELTRLQADLNDRREYLALVEAVPPVEAAFRRGEDLEVAARLVLFPDAGSQVEKRCRDVILLREFERAWCRACGREYAPGECGELAWSAVADARAGVGGSHLACPVGHVIFPLKTWVS
jgi:hypothetical protein